MPSKLMDYFNKQPRIGVLSTANGSGAVDAAVFGSPQMVDEKTVVIGSGENRTLADLRENPHAVYLIMEPGETVMDWKGIRVYLKMTALETSGEGLETYRRRIADAVGEQAAQMIAAMVKFEVTGVRPLVDMGQGWEQSV